ncbi:MAG: alkaline phosphatase [Acidobacteria bacterium]|nr:alkaline phosphatase [Acidobacteriota bacterium]
MHLSIPCSRGGLFAAVACAALLTGASAPASAQSQFNRVAAFEVINNLCDGLPMTDPCYDQVTVAEIVATTGDNQTIIYTDSPGERIGFVDITKPGEPKPAGVIDMDGEPTSVSVLRNYAVVGVNTSESYKNPSGDLVVVDIPSRTIVRRIPLGGQPDSVAVSRNNRYIAVAIENERNEDACVGGSFDGEEVDEDVCEDGGGVLGVTGQLPAGYLTIVDVIGRGPANWQTRKVSMTGLAAVSPEDPEPEFVSINSGNIAVVTMQENNHLVLVNLATGAIVDHFSAGTLDLDMIDTKEEGLITYDASLDNVAREPDGVAWISPFQFVTADEGDMFGGSRSFTVFNTNGQVVYSSGSDIEDITKRIGHYPEDRSGNKGAEPEGVEFGLFGNRRLLFIGSERASVVLVYELSGPTSQPKFLQVLPAAIGPEGLKAVPSRNLLIVSGEEDSRDDTYRAAISIYELGGNATYPTIMSANGPNRKPIAWAALSALAADRINPTKAYTVWDSYFSESRMFEIDLAQTPPTITKEIPLMYNGSPLSADPEGIVQRIGGGFYVASEGAGSCTASGCDSVGSTNRIFQVDPQGVVTKVINLPASVDALQRNNGYEGVTVVGAPGNEIIYAAFQREWPLGDPAGYCRIGRYDVANDLWSFYYYRLDAPTSPLGGWVGLSEIVHLGGSRFAVIERDNQAGADARIKKLYTFDTRGVTPLPQDSLPTDPTADDFPLVPKTEAVDLMPYLQAPHGQVKEKVEGLMVDGLGNAWIVTDNDGVEDSNGETQMINLGPVL